MKKNVLCSLALVLLTCTLSFAQTESSVSDKPIKISKDMVIKVPESEKMVYVYEIDAADLEFKSADEREKYFMGLKDEVASYRVDKENKKLYLVLDRDYIEKNKWTAAEVNKHLQKRAGYMKDTYGSYVPPAKEMEK